VTVCLVMIAFVSIMLYMFRGCELCISVAECLDVYQESLNEIEMKIVTQMVAYVLIHPAMMEDYSTASYLCISVGERRKFDWNARALCKRR